ncbi:SMC-Scp complex subunit ScpB [Rhizobium sp. G187]|uniref:SMC-Scp complex subunit ScpB n=1 Tax=Rhizobium sp. G187 TaxID=3451352 RepID=UPI003EE55BE3
MAEDDTRPDENDDEEAVVDAEYPSTRPVDPRVEEEALRIAEALVFASAQPVSTRFIEERLPRGIDARTVLLRLKDDYARRGVNLVQIEDSWAFRTAADLSFVIRSDETDIKKLSRAALEVLAIIAYHQPVTRAEIEDVRGVTTSKGTLDVLMEAGWVRFRGRRRTPGRPVTLGTTRDFLDHFGLEELRDLPGLEELKGAGLLSGRIPANFNIPMPQGEDELGDDEDPISQLDLEELGLLTPGGEAEE